MNSETFIRIGFAAIALLHALPLSGVLGKSALERGYGLSLLSADVVILLQHRALLFGAIALGCVIAAWQASWRWPIACVALISMLGFIAITAPQAHNAALNKVMWADLVGVVILSVTLALMAAPLRRT
jgi:hypothetical protein